MQVFFGVNTFDDDRINLFEPLKILVQSLNLNSLDIDDHLRESRIKYSLERFLRKINVFEEMFREEE